MYKCTNFWSIAFIVSTKIAENGGLEAHSVRLTYYKKNYLDLMHQLMD